MGARIEPDPIILGFPSIMGARNKYCHFVFQSRDHESQGSIKVPKIQNFLSNNTTTNLLPGYPTTLRDIERVEVWQPSWLPNLGSLLSPLFEYGLPKVEYLLPNRAEFAPLTDHFVMNKIL